MKICHLLDPDPTKPEVQEALKHGVIRSLARHSRLENTNLSSVDEVRNDFMKSIEYLRSLGFKRITLKNDSYVKEKLYDNWDHLLKAVSEIGTKAEEIFA